MADFTPQQINDLLRALQGLAQASSQTAAAQQANFRSLMQANDQLDDFKDSLTKGKVLTKEQQKLQDKAMALKKKELALQEKFNKALAESNRIQADGKATAEAKSRAATIASGAERRLMEAQGETQKAAGLLSDSLGGLTKGVNLAGAAMVWFGSTIKTAVLHARDQIVANNGLVEGTGSLISALADQQNQALKFGMAGKDFAAVVSANRQMVNAMGGTVHATEQVEESMTSFYMMTGSNAEAFKALSESMTSFANKGISPTSAVLKQYTQDVQKLSAQTGMNQEQARAYYDDLANDEDTINILRLARLGERNAILANQRALLQTNISLGMTADQAKEAAKMLTKMNDAKPIDRLKQAAKLQMAAGALGIDGGQAAGEAIRRGGRGSAAQQKADQETIAKFMNKMSNQVDKMSGGDLQSQIAVQSIVDKAGLEGMMGKGSPFSSTLGTALAKPVDEVMNHMVKADADKYAQGLKQADLMYKQLGVLISGEHWAGVIASGVGLILATMLSGKLWSGAKGLLNLVKGGRGAAAAVAEGAEGVGAAAQGAAEGAAGAAEAAAASAGKLSKLGGLFSKIAPAAKGLGVAGAVLDAGMGVNDLMNGKEQTEMHGLDYISPMRWGMRGGNMINNGIKAATGDEGGLGSKIYDWLHPDEDKKLGLGKYAFTQNTQRKDPAGEAVKKTAESNDAVKTATQTSADGITSQLKKMDSHQATLQSIADMTQQVIDLNQKQLIAMTMTEKERSDVATRKNLRKDNKYASQYNAV